MLRNIRVLRLCSTDWKSSLNHADNSRFKYPPKELSKVTQASVEPGLLNSDSSMVKTLLYYCNCTFRLPCLPMTVNKGCYGEHQLWLNRFDGPLILQVNVPAVITPTK